MQSGYVEAVKKLYAIGKVRRIAEAFIESGRRFLARRVRPVQRGCC